MTVSSSGRWAGSRRAGIERRRCATTDETHSRTGSRRAADSLRWKRLEVGKGSCWRIGEDHHPSGCREPISRGAKLEGAPCCRTTRLTPTTIRHALSPLDRPRQSVGVQVARHASVQLLPRRAERAQGAHGLGPRWARTALASHTPLTPGSHEGPKSKAASERISQFQDNKIGRAHV